MRQQPGRAESLRRGVRRQAPAAHRKWPRAAQRPRAESARRQHPRGRPRPGRRVGPRHPPETPELPKSLGATVTRAHYPLHPAFMEALDRAGIMFWAQAPVYQVRPEKMVGSVRDAPSRPIATRSTPASTTRRSSPGRWATSSSGEFANGAYFNETQRDYQAYIDKARERHPPDRPDALGRHRPPVGAGPARPLPRLQRLDVIGANEYFGWYRASEVGRPSRTADLGPFLDRLHQRLSGQAAVRHRVRRGVQPQRARDRAGHVPFQNKWTLDHLRIHASRPFVNGSILWALRDFRVHPTWGGGNPKPNPPWNNKGADRGERRHQAGLADRPAELPLYATLPLGSGSAVVCDGRRASTHAASTPPTAPRSGPARTRLCGAPGRPAAHHRGTAPPRRRGQLAQVAVEDPAHDQVGGVAEHHAARADMDRVRRGEQPRPQPADHVTMAVTASSRFTPLKATPGPGSRRQRVREQVAEAGVQERRGAHPHQPVGLARLDAELVQLVARGDVDRPRTPTSRRA